jgi:hypothetical protein
LSYIQATRTSELLDVATRVASEVISALLASAIENSIQPWSFDVVVAWVGVPSSTSDQYIDFVNVDAVAVVVSMFVPAVMTVRETDGTSPDPTRPAAATAGAKADPKIPAISPALVRAAVSLYFILT